MSVTCKKKNQKKSFIKKRTPRSPKLFSTLQARIWTVTSFHVLTQTNWLSETIEHEFVPESKTQARKACNTLVPRVSQCVKWDWQADTTPTVRGICTFAVFLSVSRPFRRFALDYEGHFELCCKEKLEPLDRAMANLKECRVLSRVEGICSYSFKLLL